MKLTDHVYQLTGHITGLNSNTFAIDTAEGIILIDTGYREYYWETMQRMMRLWNLNPDRIIAVFVTHAHFDHAGNAHIFAEKGIPVYASHLDAEAMRIGGDLVMENVFGTKFTACPEVMELEDGQEFHFGNAELTTIALPGHTRGAMGFLVRTDDRKILFLGDLFLISGTSPSDEIELEVGYSGSVDYDAKANLESFRKLTDCDVDIVAPGHRGVYYGDSRALFQKIYEVVQRPIT